MSGEQDQPKSQFRHFRLLFLLVPPEQVRATDRELRKVNREVERDRTQLEREEKKLEMEIKKAAKAGNKPACTVLAKQLVQLRKQKQRTYVASSQVPAYPTNNIAIVNLRSDAKKTPQANGLCYPRLGVVR